MSNLVQSPPFLPFKTTIPGIPLSRSSWQMGIPSLALHSIMLSAIHFVAHALTSPQGHCSRRPHTITIQSSVVRNYMTTTESHFARSALSSSRHVLMFVPSVTLPIAFPDGQSPRANLTPSTRFRSCSISYLFSFTLSVYFVSGSFYPPPSQFSRSRYIFFFVQSLGFCMNVASPLSFYSHLIIYIPLPRILLDLQRHFSRALE